MDYAIPTANSAAAQRQFIMFHHQRRVKMSFYPIPSQVEQAAAGLLKEKSFGSISGGA